MMSNREYLLSLVEQYCRRSDGILKSSMKNKKHWDKLGLSREYDDLMEYQVSDDCPFAQIIWHLVNDVNERVTCNNQLCDKELKWNKATSSYPQYCSRECSSSDPRRVDKWRQTNFERYGEGQYGQVTEDGLKKRARTNLRKYGEDSYSKTQNFKKLMSEKNPMYNPDNVKKTKETMNALYGGHPLNVPEILKRREETTMRNHGVPHPMKSSKVKNIHRGAMVNKYGVGNNKHINLTSEAIELLTNEDVFLQEWNKNGAIDISNRYNLHISTIYKAAHKFNVPSLTTGTSQVEMTIREYIEFLDPNLEIIYGDGNVLNGREIDIYIPSLSIGIEINGLYWHSDEFKDKNYHFNKWKECRELGIDLYSFNTSDLSKHIDIIKRKLKYILCGVSGNVGARKCTIGAVSIEDERELLEEYHIQGFTKNRNKTYGAYYNGELVGVIGYIMRKNYMEIVRYCTKGDVVYSGLFSRLLAHVIKETGHSGDIVSFSNNDHSNGKLYSSSGFSIDKILPPSYWYTNDFVNIYNRQRFTKDKILSTFGIEVEGKTERELMESLGYRRYYDTGKIKWILKRS